MDDGYIDWSEDWDEDDKLVPDDWMTLLETVDALVAGMRISYIEAKSNLIELIQDSRLELMCRKIREEADFDEILWNEPLHFKLHPGQRRSGFTSSNPNPKKFSPLSADFFSRRDGWIIDPTRIDWHTATIVANAPTEFHDECKPPDYLALTRRAATWVKVRKNGSYLPRGFSFESAAMPQSSNENNVQPINNQYTDSRKSNAGRKRGEDWNKWIAELVLVVQNDGIDLDVSAEQFFDQINERLIARNVTGPEWSKVEKAVSEIRNRWREAKVNQEV